MNVHIPRIGLILARAQGGVIGHKGQMPWHLPEDLKHFKALTMGQPVLMGRRTWESLPARFRPLEGRLNIVLSRQSGLLAPGPLTACDLSAALRLCAGAPQVWVIGGAQLYAQALPLARVAEITEIHTRFDGDAFAPELPGDWTEVGRSPIQTSAGGLPFTFVRYERRGRG